MAFDTAPLPAKKIAVIGAGISGLASAYYLSAQHRVTLYEAEPRLGGHARTVMAGQSRNQPVDTGFIVFNYANYPHLTQMFRDLEVPVAKSDMSFGVSVDQGRVEYALHSLGGLVGQRRNLVRPQFYRMVADILRFNQHAEAMLDQTPQSIGDLLDKLQLGEWFRTYYLLPVSGAIWSSEPQQILDFPAQTLIRFFRNHALLSRKGQHQWWTVQGGSIDYLRRLEARLVQIGTVLRRATPVLAVERFAMGCKIVSVGGMAETFDEVIFACHADQALRLMAQPTLAERQILGAIRFQDNHMVLHADAAQMPVRRACWSSWVYRTGPSRGNNGIGVTYWMNRLQNIPQHDPLFISLNPATPVDPRLVYDETTFRHPVFDQAAVSAQARLAELQGQNHCWFAGAYTRNGFHEDGIASAHRIARLMREQVAA